MRGRLQPSQWGGPPLTTPAYRDVCTVHTEYLPIFYSMYIHTSQDTVPTGTYLPCHILGRGCQGPRPKLMGRAGLITGLKEAHYVGKEVPTP